VPLPLPRGLFCFFIVVPVPFRAVMFVFLNGTGSTVKKQT
jgi:hypothetical protein